MRNRIANLLSRLKRPRIWLLAVLILSVAVGLYFWLNPVNFYNRRDIRRAIKTLSGFSKYNTVADYNINGSVTWRVAGQITSPDEMTLRMGIVPSGSTATYFTGYNENIALYNIVQIKGDTVKLPVGGTIAPQESSIVDPGDEEKPQEPAKQASFDQKAFAEAMRQFLSPVEYLKASERGKYIGKTKVGVADTRRYRITRLSKEQTDFIDTAMKVLTDGHFTHKQAKMLDIYISEKTNTVDKIKIYFDQGDKATARIEINFNSYGK